METPVVKKDTRSDSISSVASTASPPASPTQRRGSGTLFASLHEAHKRDDPRLMARRQSLNEQRPAPGMFGKMWNT